MESSPVIDFSSNSKIVWAVAEGERLTYGHLFNPTFATETSLIEPLPHQRLAVYEYLLKQPRLRFLLADDAGAGKTIMTGLYIRELLSRRLIRRVLIVPPAGLVGNWEREMKALFSLTFRIASGSEAKSNNPFIGDSDLLIISVDTLAGERMFSRLCESEVLPYDLVIFDEAHKLSADREPDFIHRFGQKHDPVIIINLVAGKTREGRVLKTLLDKLERIRKELTSDKVFDVVGRVFENTSIKQYMEQAVTEEGADEAERQIDKKLTKEQVETLWQQEESLFGKGGDVRSQLPQLNAQRQHEELRRLLPGYIRRFIEKAAPLVGIGIEGDLDGYFSFQPLNAGALDWLWPVLEAYPIEQRDRLTVYKPESKRDAIFLHPGEPVFDRFREYVCGRFAQAALKGGVFIDANAQQPYLFHLALISVVRTDTTQRESRKEILESRIIGLKQSDEVVEAAPEYLTLLKEGEGIPPLATFLVVKAQESCELAKVHALSVTQSLIVERRQALLETLSEREGFLRRGYDYQEAELAARRAKLRDKANGGDSHAKGEMTKIKKQQRLLSSLREDAIATLRREPELIVPGDVTFLAHALVVPSTEPEDKKRQDKEIEAIAVRVAWGYEESQGAVVQNVSTPQLAREAGLTDHPGFDGLKLHTRDF